jgi:hypothetical protein
MEEVPRSKPALFLLDNRHALAREDEEILLARIGVIEAARLPRQQDGQCEADLVEPVALEIGSPTHGRPTALENSPEPERLVGEPRCVADVEDEPSVGDRDEARLSSLEVRLLRRAQLAVACSTDGTSSQSSSSP